MRVEKVMTRGVRCIGPETTLQDAARLMGELDVGPLPVCDHDRLAGIVTDRDITVRGIAKGVDPRRTTVRDVMTPGVHYCFEDQDVDQAMEMMRENQIRRLAVLDRNKRLVGIVSIGDLAVDCKEEQQVGETLEAISEAR